MRSLDNNVMEEEECYKTVSKKKTIFYIFINLIGNI